MKMRKSLLIIVLLGAGVATARADGVPLYLTASLFPDAGTDATCAASGCTIEGDLVIDNTTGEIFSSNALMFEGESPFSDPFGGLASVVCGGDFCNFGFSEPVFPPYGGGGTVDFTTACPSTFGVCGGTIVGGVVFSFYPPYEPPFFGNPGFPDGDASWGITSGSLTPTPEPGTDSLMLIGLASLGLMMVMRKRIGLGIPRAS
jgi:hypothetical protein